MISVRFVICVPLLLLAFPAAAQQAAPAGSAECGRASTGRARAGSGNPDNTGAKARPCSPCPANVRI